MVDTTAGWIIASTGISEIGTSTPDGQTSVFWYGDKLAEGLPSKITYQGILVAYKDSSGTLVIENAEDCIRALCILFKQENDNDMEEYEKLGNYINKHK